MKRLCAIAILLAPTLLLAPRLAMAQDTSSEVQSDTSLATGSISPGPLTIEEETSTSEAPVQQVSPPPVENLKLDDKFLSWLSDLDAISGVSARADIVNLRNISNQLYVSNLVIDDPAFDLNVDIGSATLSKASEPFGLYVVGADRIILEDVRIRFGETEFQTDDMVLTSALLPSLPLSSKSAAATTGTRFERKRALFTKFVRLVAGSVNIPSLSVRIYSDKKETQVLAESVYRDIQVSALKGGKIGSMALVGAETLSPPLEPLVEESFGKAELSNFNFQTVLKLFDGGRAIQQDTTFF
ncbi:MAG: hypothetical protein ABJ349_12705, partial [Hyphomicrobiales bacterium]